MTLAECEELAAELGEPDGWAVAARFAAEILPGIFRLDDPCVRLAVGAGGSARVGGRSWRGCRRRSSPRTTRLGWVYQFWQKEKKDEVNASERKIGGADLGPVTQLFTENYMVRFLLENSLGAWWAARHPDSPLVKDWEYLRFDDDGDAGGGVVRRVAGAGGRGDGDGSRVAGRVTSWSRRSRCCGSMRAEEEGLDSGRGAGRGACATTCSGSSSTRAVCRSRCSRSRWRRGRPAAAGASCRSRTSPAPGSRSRHRSRSGRRSPTATERSRTRSSGCTSCSATPTPSAASSTPRRAVETADRRAGLVRRRRLGRHRPPPRPSPRPRGRRPRHRRPRRRRSWHRPSRRLPLPQLHPHRDQRPVSGARSPDRDLRLFADRSVTLIESLDLATSLMRRGLVDLVLRVAVVSPQELAVLSRSYETSARRPGVVHRCLLLVACLAPVRFESDHPATS